MRLGPSTLHPLKIWDLQPLKIEVFDPFPSQDGTTPGDPDSATPINRYHVHMSHALRHVFLRLKRLNEKAPPDSLELPVGPILIQFKLLPKQE